MKQGRLPGGVGLKDREEWRLLQTCRSQILIPSEPGGGGGSTGEGQRGGGVESSGTCGGGASQLNEPGRQGVIQ